MAANPKSRTNWGWSPERWMVVCLLLPTFIYIWAVREPAPRWRVARFDNEGFEGVPEMREARDVNHDWKKRHRAEEAPEGGSSVRWDSCLNLERGQRVVFQLTSENSARLFIDGEPVIDDWGVHPRRTRGTELTLPAGVHHLRVDYSGTSQSASVTLVASFDDKRPRRIAPERLSFPDGDSEHPCD